MADNDTPTGAPETLLEWQTMLKQSADLLVTVDPAYRPMRAGNLAGALNACKTGVPYGGRDVMYRPHGDHAITVSASDQTLRGMHERLLRLQLPGIASITFEQGEVGRLSRLVLIPHPRPAA